MNGKKYGNAVFYIMGTCILISVSIVLILNMVNDSRLFGGNYNQTTATQPTQVATSDPNSSPFDTFKYNRTFTPDPLVDETEKKPKVTGTTTPESISLQGITVELISYVKVREVAESFKETLENAGFVVTLSKPKTKNPYTTRIIEHNNKGVGIRLFKILKAGVIIKDFKDTNDPKVPKDLYTYDLTVILGEDYNP